MERAQHAIAVGVQLRLMSLNQLVEVDGGVLGSLGQPTSSSRYQTLLDPTEVGVAAATEASDRSLSSGRTV